MSNATELLNGLTDEQVATYTADPASEPHIVVNSDKTIVVPAVLQQINVQHEHNVETVTFDCPRYWDGHDMSKWAVYINYTLSNGYEDVYPADNVVVDRADKSVMHFEWTISRNVTQVVGTVAFGVCIKETDENGIGIRHWNSKKNTQMSVSEGQECSERTGDVVDEHSDLIGQLIRTVSEVKNSVPGADQVQKILDVFVAETVTRTDYVEIDYTDYITKDYIRTTQNALLVLKTCNAVTFPCVVGEEYTINFDGVALAASSTPCFICDSNLVRIQRIFSETYEVTDGDTYITIPADGAYLVFNYCNANSTKPILKKLTEITETNYKVELEDVKSNIIEVRDIRVGADGVTYSSAGESVRTQLGSVGTQLGNVQADLDALKESLYDYYPCDYSEYIKVGTVYFTYNETASGVAYTGAAIPCAAGEQYIINFKGVSVMGSTTPCFINGADMVRVQRIFSEPEEVTEEDVYITIPENGAFIIFNYATASPVKPSLKKYGMPKFSANNSDTETEEVKTVLYPEYWQSAIDIAVEKINTLQHKGGKDVSTFAFITDTHTKVNDSGAFAKILEQVMKECEIPIYLHGGDFVYGSGIISKEDFIAEIKHYKEIFKDIEHKGLLALGNHDVAYGINEGFDSHLTDEEIYSYIFRINESKNGIVYGDTNTYFYKDIPAQKVRYIVLDCTLIETELDENQFVISNNKMWNRKFGTKQFEWLAQTALNVPNGYSIVICTHVPPYRAADKNAIGWTGEEIILDCEIALGIVNAYRNKTSYTYSGTLGVETYNISVDFTNAVGEVVCWVAGHTHKDYIFNCDGLQVVSTANNSLSMSVNPTGFSPTKTSGTATEYAMDFLCINKATKTCNIVRLGAELAENDGGRSFSYGA